MPLRFYYNGESGVSDDLAMATIFYSWESDLHAKTTRNLIEGCLNNAIQQLGRDDELDVDPSLDRDTRGVTGAPVILDTILEKIDSCIAFVADVSIINSGDSSRPTPNPNVAIELGYAIKACGWDCILPVCNEHYGTIDKLPFDIPERRVIAYTLSEDPTPEEINAAKEKLTAVFKIRLKDILKQNRESILSIQIGDPDSERLFPEGHDCHLTDCLFSDFPHGQFPDHERYVSAGVGMRMRDNSLNADYFRDVATYTIEKNRTQRFAFAIINNSAATLLSPRLEVVIGTPDFTLIGFDTDSFPDRPDESIFVGGGIPAMLEKHNRRNHATLKQTDDLTIIRADFENIQAKRTAWSSCCHLGTAVNSITLNCRLFADNLKQPFEQQLVMHFSMAKESRKLKEWIAADFTATPVAAPLPGDPTT